MPTEFVRNGAIEIVTQFGAFTLIVVEGLGIAVMNDKDFVEPQEIEELELSLGKPMWFTLKEWQGKKHHIASTSAVRDMWIIPRR